MADAESASAASCMTFCFKAVVSKTRTPKDLSSNTERFARVRTAVTSDRIKIEESYPPERDGQNAHSFPERPRSATDSPVWRWHVIPREPVKTQSKNDDPCHTRSNVFTMAVMRAVSSTPSGAGRKLP